MTARPSTWRISLTSSGRSSWRLATPIETNTRLIGARQLALPALRVARGPRQHVRPELGDEVGFLRHRHEVGGVEGAEPRMLPAQLGLEAGQRLGGEVEDRVIDDLELLLVERGAQLALQRHPPVGVGAHLGVVDLDAVGARALGAVHGDLGVLQEPGRVLVGAVVGGDADRGRQHDLPPGDRDRRPHRAAHLLGQHGELARVGLVEQEQRELIAPDARQRVLRPQVAGETAGDREQQAVGRRQIDRRRSPP